MKKHPPFSRRGNEAFSPAWHDWGGHSWKGRSFKGTGRSENARLLVEEAMKLLDDLIDAEERAMVTLRSVRQQLATAETLHRSLEERYRNEQYRSEAGEPNG